MPYVSHFGTSGFRRRLLQWIPFKRLHTLKNVVDTMHRRAAEIFNEKKALLDRGDEALHHQVGEGKDLMSILREQALLGLTPLFALFSTSLFLVRENMRASAEDRLSEEELIGQMVYVPSPFERVLSIVLSVLVLIGPASGTSLQHDVVRGDGHDVEHAFADSTHTRPAPRCADAPTK